jgi:hypothetical protein
MVIRKRTTHAYYYSLPDKLPAIDTRWRDLTAGYVANPADGSVTGSLQAND